MSSPNPARDPKGTLPPGAVASQRSAGGADQRVCKDKACPWNQPDPLLELAFGCGLWEHWHEGEAVVIPVRYE